MRAWSTVIAALLLSTAAALAALVVVVPSPTRAAAVLAVGAGEKSLLVIGAALAAAFLAWRVMVPGFLVAARLSMFLAILAMGLAAIPPFQALRLAAARGVSLDIGRYLLAPIDVGAARPHQTVVYATVDGQALALDVYRPAGGGKVPAVILIHGGGWSSGDKGEAPRASEWLAAQGYAVFDIQYRLAPQPNWQTAVGDVKCAIGWVKQKAGEVGVNVDPERVALLGRSAGGHLALLAAYTPESADFPPSCPAPDTRVDAVISFYAPADLVWGYWLPANLRVYDTSAKLRAFLGGPPDVVPERYHKTTITNLVTPRSPRTLLVHGGRDQFVSPEHVDRLVPKLRAAGVAHDALVIPYGQHGFDYVSGGLSGQIAEAAVLALLRGPGK